MLLLGVLGGCATTPPAICVVPKQQRLQGAPRAENWYRLLVDRGLDGAPVDCTGAPVKWTEVQCLEPAEPATPFPLAPFSPSDIVTSRVSRDEQLVWIVTQRFSDGDGLGPVALVRDTKEGPEVVVTGALRARTRRARLTLVQLDGHRFLEAEGESCKSNDDPSTCHRSMVLVPEQNQRFVQASLYGQTGACVGPAEFYLHRDRVVSLQSGWKRKFEQNATLTFQPDRLVVQENVIVSDFDPSKPGTPARVDRRADGERVVRYEKGRLVASDTSLWSRVLDQTGEGH